MVVGGWEAAMKGAETSLDSPRKAIDTCLVLAPEVIATRRNTKIETKL